jgi:hypothetical protein
MDNRLLSSVIESAYADSTKQISKYRKSSLHANSKNFLPIGLLTRVFTEVQTFIAAWHKILIEVLRESEVQKSVTH